jgi:hypothetical protein
MKNTPDTEPKYTPAREKEKDEDPLQFPGDLRPEWEREDSEIAGRKPDLEEIEEDSSDL